MAGILNLSPRLEAIVDLCPKSKIIADIGCDHGLVMAELILEKKTNKVIATEKSEHCLNKAILLADSINISNFVSFRLGDGFEATTRYDDIRLAVIAGMGGDEIIHILESKPAKLFDFVLQPMKDTPLLREYLISHGFKILVDKMIKEDDKFYNVIRVTRGNDTLSELEIYFGRTNFTENYVVLYEYLSKRQVQLANLKDQVGELAAKVQQEYDYVNEALQLFESDAEEQQDAQTEQNIVEDSENQEINQEEDDKFAETDENEQKYDKPEENTGNNDGEEE